MQYELTYNVLQSFQSLFATRYNYSQMHKLLMFLHFFLSKHLGAHTMLSWSSEYGVCLITWDFSLLQDSGYFYVVKVFSILRYSVPAYWRFDAKGRDINVRVKHIKTWVPLDTIYYLPLQQ